MTTNNMSSSIVGELLRVDNYANWRACVKNYLLAQDLWDIVEATTEPPKLEDGEEHYKEWRKKNAAALHAIQISCSPEMLSEIREMSSANIAWNTLANQIQYLLKSTGVSSSNPQQLERVNQGTQQEVSAGINSPQSSEINPANPPLANQTISGNRPTVARVNSVIGTDDTEYFQFQAFVQAINVGDLVSVKDFIKHTPNAKTAKINSFGSRALHFATDAGQVRIVEELVNLMSPEELELQDNSGSTALVRAAISGNVKIAECMIRVNNKNILGIANNEGDTPVAAACGAGHKRMTRYLYSVTPQELLNGTLGSLFLFDAITVKLFDVALDLVRKYPHLATVPSRFGVVPLQALSRMTSVFPSGCQLTFWKRLISRCIHAQLPSFSDDFCVHIPQKEESDKENILAPSVIDQFLRIGMEFLGIDGLYDMKLNQLYAAEILHCMCQKLPTSNNYGVSYAFFEAVRHGTVELVVELCKANPQLLLLADVNVRSLFFLAIQFRQEKIFSLIYGLHTRKDTITSCVDKFHNNMLHIGGMLAPPPQLAHISGAALKMQRELQWYKEVERVVSPSFKVYPNTYGDQPYQVFTKEHKELMKQGEEWMKDNATSCSFVAALIITVMFTAAFTIPGGNDQNTGYPIFSQKTAFKLFVISDAVSLFASTTSVLMFLGILTSRYAEEDFLKSLPTKLIIGLSTLFISIAAMVVAFCAALLIMFKAQLNIIVPVFVLASFPIAAFVWLQFPLLIEIFMSTYGPGIFDRKIKPWL